MKRQKKIEKMNKEEINKKNNTIDITKDTNIEEVVSKYPQTIEVFLDYNLSCIGCPLSRMESIQEGAIGHGLSESDITSLVERLNEVATFKE